MADLSYFTADRSQLARSTIAGVVDIQGSQTTFPLTAGYVYGVSGRAICSSFVPTTSGTLTDFWFVVHSLSGTWSSTDQLLNYEIRDGYTTNSTIPGVLVSSGTVNVSATDTYKWITKSSLSITLTGTGKTHWLVIYDADGDATNYATVLLGQNPANVINKGFQTAYSTTVGFSAAPTSDGRPPMMGVKVQNDIIVGSIFTTNNTASISYRRGVVIKVKSPVVLAGMISGQISAFVANTATFSLYLDGVPPSGTPLWSYSLLANSTANAGTLFRWFPADQWYVLRPGNTYRFVVLPVGGGSAGHGKMSGGPGNQPTDFRAVLGGSAGFEKYCYTEDTGGLGSSWTDDLDAINVLSPLLLPYHPPTIFS
jgi:hypothetical protein